MARANFEDDSEVVTERGAAKSQSTETTFDHDIADLVVLEGELRRLAERLCANLEGRGRRGRTVAIKVRLDDWTTVTRARTLERATNDTRTVTRVALELLRAYAPARPVRLLGVRLAGFEDLARADVAPAAPLPPTGQLALPDGLVQGGGEAAARLAGHGVLHAELVEHADDRAAQALAAVGVLLGGDRVEQRVEAALELAGVERGERLAQGGVLLEPDAGGEPVGGERAGDVAEQRERGLALAALVQQTGRARRRRRRGPARARAPCAGAPRRPRRRARRPRRARARRGSARRAGPGWAPVNSATTLPSRNAFTAGMPWIRKAAARLWLASVSSLASSTLPSRAVTARSSTGVSWRHGPHHAAQKSTTTGTS